MESLNIATIIGLYAMMFVGVFLHVVKRIKGNRLKNLKGYIEANSLRILVSWITGTSLFFGWLWQPEVATTLGFSYAPGLLSSLLLGYVADSVWAMIPENKSGN